MSLAGFRRIGHPIAGAIAGGIVGVELFKLANLEAAGISTTLVCAVKKGVNDAEIGDIVHRALSYRLRGRRDLPAGAGRRAQRGFRQEPRPGSTLPVRSRCSRSSS